MTYDYQSTNLTSLSFSKMYTVSLSNGKYTPYFPVSPSYALMMPLNHFGFLSTINFITSFFPSKDGLGAVYNNLAESDFLWWIPN